MTYACLADNQPTWPVAVLGDVRGVGRRGCSADPKRQAAPALRGEEIDLLARSTAHEIVGRIDRLAVTPTQVLIADFKTGAAPADGVTAPPDYVRQLALYSDVLARIYPDKAMRALLVWTAGPAIHRIEESRLKSVAAETLRVVNGA